MRFRTTHALLVCLLSCAFAVFVQTCRAQTFSASIAGVVTDPSGSVVQGAKVQLRNMGTNDTRDATSTAVGSYKFDNLLPGTYEVTVDAPGFRRYIQSNMILPANTAASVNVPLTLGSAEQHVQVTAESVLLDTESATNSVTMDSHLIEALPNSYRNPLNFVFGLAGTTEGQAGLTTRSGTLDQFGSMFGLSGGRTGNAQILIDGAPSTAVDWGGLFVAPNNDAVQEQQITQNVYDAQYERSGSGVVTLVTKSGGQQYHGTIYDYFRNSALDANSWSNDNNVPITKKDLLHRNQFGATFGGHIPGTSHWFFFGAYEGLRQPGTVSNTLTVPTDAERGGDFSHTYNPDGSLEVIYDPFSTTQVCCDSSGNPYFTRTSFLQETGQNKIPSNIINSVGQNIVNLYPRTNRSNFAAVPNDNLNFFKQGSASTINDKIDWRVDWDQSSKNRMFVRMSDRIRQNIPQACFFCNGADENSDSKDWGSQVALNDTYTPSPTWVIDLYAAYDRWYEAQTRTDYAKGNLTTIGLSNGLAQVPMLPQVGAADYSGQGAGYSDFNEYVRSGATWVGNITKQLDRHTLKFGANYDVAFMNNRHDVPVALNFDRGFTSCEPDLDANGNPTGGPCHAQVGGGSTTGNAIASMLLGTGSGQANITMDPAMSLHTIGLYLQDQWRVNNRLTVTAGLRYENQRPATERFNRLSYFNPSVVNPLNATVGPINGQPLMGAFQYASSGNRFAWGPDNLNFAPRLGVAYKVTDKLVARVGAGLFYSPTSAMISFDQPGQFVGFTSTTDWIGSTNSGYTPANLVSNPFPNGIVQPVGNANGAMTLVGDGAGQIWLAGTHKVGYTQQWSADLQYELARNSVFQIGYMGSRGRRLMYGNPDLNIDQLPTKYLALGESALDNQVPNPFYGVANPNSYLGSQVTVPYNQLLRPFPEFTYLNLARSAPGASSQYDSLNVKFTKQFSNGFGLLSTYVWSKALDDGSEDFIGWAIGGIWSDATNTKRDYTTSMHDVPQSFATQFYYQLPYGHGKQFGGGAPAMVNHILGDWEVSGVVRFTSGLPLLTPFYGNSGVLNYMYGFPGYGWGNLVGNPKPGHQTPNDWINAAAFQQVNFWPGSGPDAVALGDVPSRLSSLREGATKNVDLGVAKVFGTERLKARFGADFLNIFNHPTYGGIYYGGWGSNINLNIDSGQLGKVYGTRNDSRNIQMSLRVSF